MFIQEPKIKTQLIRIDIKIKGKNYQFLIDTGSVYSYIDESLILENDLKVQETTNCSAILVDGSTIQSSRETTIAFNIQDDESILYKTRVKIINKMSLTGILGMNFLLENAACIDIAEEY
ncbi:hypothetical protein DMUE_2883 [Dictyocoela muelleri]|nr:hypothetical protein DMUE_2883 [Dictyocoela muelleri]